MGSKSKGPGLAMLCAVVTLVGCASAPQRTFDILKMSQWELDKGPLVSELITTPMESPDSVADRAARYSRDTASEKDKFESDDAFKARGANTPPLANAFLAIPLSTRECSSYDFPTKTYSIACQAFRRSNVLSSKVEVTGSIKLANVYASRDVEMQKLSRVYLSTTVDAVGKLAMSADEAKVVDGDLMVGLLFRASGATYDFGGCGKSELTFLDSKVCKEIGFKSGSVIENWDTVIIAQDLLEFVVFRRSNNHVLFHKTYGLHKL